MELGDTGYRSTTGGGSTPFWEDNQQDGEYFQGRRGMWSGRKKRNTVVRNRASVRTWRIRCALSGMPKQRMES